MRMFRFLALLFALGVAAGQLSAQCSGTHEIDLSWLYTQGSDPATGFYVFIEQQGQTKFTQENAAQLPVSQLTYLDCSIGGGYTYSYYVVAVDANGTRSNPSATWTSPVVPVAPATSVNVTQSNGNNVITWTASADGGAYTITRSTQQCGASGATFTQIATGVAGTTDTDANPPAAGAYCYGVAAVINSVSSTVAFGGVSVPPNAATGVTGKLVR